jgi:hypothetical protein
MRNGWLVCVCLVFLPFFVFAWVKELFASSGFWGFHRWGFPFRLEEGELGLLLSGGIVFPFGVMMWVHEFMWFFCLEECILEVQLLEELFFSLMS